MYAHRIIPTAEPFFFQGGPTGCLLIHGFTGTPKEMRWLGEYLADQGHTVLGVRLAGHATEPCDMIRSRWYDWIASVEDGWHLLSSCAERIFVIGLSMGGVLSLTFSAYFPVAGVVAMATPHHLPNDPRLPFVKPLSLVMPYIPKNVSDWYDQEAFNQHTCYPVDPTRSFAELRDLVLQMQEVLPKVIAPALLIYSRDDQTVLAADRHMEGIQDNLGSRHISTLWIEKSSHVITRDAQRQKVFSAVGDFVNQHIDHSVP